MFDGDDDIYDDAACHNDGESVGINLHQGEHADDGDE